MAKITARKVAWILRKVGFQSGEEPRARRGQRGAWFSTGSGREGFKCRSFGNIIEVRHVTLPLSRTDVKGVVAEYEKVLTEVGVKGITNCGDVIYIDVDSN